MSEQQVLDHYLLTLTLAGQGVPEQTVVVTGKGMADLQGTTYKVDEYVWERYGTEDNHIDVRRDLVIARVLEPIYVRDVRIDPDADDDGDHRASDYSRSPE